MYVLFDQIQCISVSNYVHHRDYLNEKKFEENKKIEMLISIYLIHQTRHRNLVIIHSSLSIWYYEQYISDVDFMDKKKERGKWKSWLQHKTNQEEEIMAMNFFLKNFSLDVTYLKERNSNNNWSKYAIDIQSNENNPLSLSLSLEKTPKF
jgi:hypothetical protein